MVVPDLKAGDENIFARQSQIESLAVSMSESAAPAPAPSRSRGFGNTAYYAVTATQMGIGSVMCALGMFYVLKCLIKGCDKLGARAGAKWVVIGAFLLGVAVPAFQSVASLAMYG
jgi:hypothetical protein